LEELDESLLKSLILESILAKLSVLWDIDIISLTLEETFCPEGEHLGSKIPFALYFFAVKHPFGTFFLHINAIGDIFRTFLSTVLKRTCILIIQRTIFHYKEPLV